MVKLLFVSLALAATGAGFVAAYQWYRASAVQIDLGYWYPGCPPDATYRRGGIDLSRGHESAISEASILNKVAAQWTAASVALSALATVVSALA